MTDDLIWTCAECGEVREPRPSGICFKCHVKGVSFNFVGGGGYGRKVWNDQTIGEGVRAIFKDIDKTGAQPEYAGSSWYAGPS